MALSPFAAQNSLAQSNAAGVFGLIGGMIAAAQVQAAKEAWSSQPEARLYCAQKALARHNLTLPALIQNGVMPSDPRLAPIGSECSRFEPGNLRSNYRCNALDESGATVVSTCNQAFGQVDGSGIAQVIDARTAIDLYFSDGSFLLVDVESDAGKQQRYRQAERQRLVADLTALRGSVESLHSSRSESVRAESQKLAKRIVSAMGPKATVSAGDVETIRADYKALAGFAEIENARFATLDNLNSVRSAAEQKLSSEIPQEIHEDFSALQAQYTQILQEPSPVFSLDRAQLAIGPTYDCTKAKDPLGKIICSDKGLSRLDVDLLRPYYVLRFSAPDQRNTLKQEAVAFTQSVLQTCGIPEKGTVPNASVKKAIPCIAAEYRRQRDQWQAQLSHVAPASAREETGRSLDEHVQLQKLLQGMGYIPAAEKADGIYGAGTRTAISNFQTAENIAVDGLLSDETARRLLQKGAQPNAGGDTGFSARLGDLANRYASLSERIDQYTSQQVRKRRLLDTVAEAEAYAKEKSALQLPARVVTSLNGLLSDAGKARANPDLDALERFASSFKAIKKTADGSVTVLNATTSGNRFVLEGGPNDVLVFYNDSGKAPSLVRNLKGDLAFEGGKSSICQPHDGVPEKNFVKLVNERLEKAGQKLAFPLSRCNAGNLESYDLIVVTRGQLQQSDYPLDTAAILKAVDGGMFKSMISVTDQDVTAVLQAEAARALEIEKGVEDGSIKGFGLAVLTSGSKEMCLAVSESDREAHELFLKPQMARLTEELKSMPTMKLSSIEDAFIAAKRGQCGAVYASESDLKSLTGALRRDQVAFRYLPVLLEPETLVKTREQVALLAKERAEAEARARIAEQEARQRYAEFQQRVAHDASGDYILVLRDPGANGDICYYEDPEIAQKALDFLRERLKQQYPSFGMGGLFKADSFEGLFSSQSCAAALVPAGDYEDVRVMAEHLVDQTFPADQVRSIRTTVDARSEDRLKPYQSISDDYQCYSKLRSAARDACLAGVGYMAGWREADSIQLRAGNPVSECYGSSMRQADWLAIGGSVAEKVYSKLRAEFRYDESLRNTGAKSLVYCDEEIITKAERIGFIPRAPMATVKKAIQGPTLTRSRSSATAEEEVYGPFSPGIWQTRAMGGRPDGQCDLTKSYTEFKDGKQYHCNLMSPNKCEVSTARYRKVATNTYAQDLKNHELTLRRSETGTQVTPVSVELTDMEDLLKGWTTLWHAQSRLGILMLGGSYRYKCKT